MLALGILLGVTWEHQRCRVRRKAERLVCAATLERVKRVTHASGVSAGKKAGYRDLVEALGMPVNGRKMIPELRAVILKKSPVAYIIETFPDKNDLYFSRMFNQLPEMAEPPPAPAPLAPALPVPPAKEKKP